MNARSVICDTLRAKKDCVDSTAVKLQIYRMLINVVYD